MHMRAVDALHHSAAVPGRPTRPRRWPEGLRYRGFEKHQVGGWSYPGAVGQTVLPSDGSRESVFSCVIEIKM
jgi:hypothetical protein